MQVGRLGLITSSLPSDRGKEGGKEERDEGCSMRMDKVVLSRFALSVFF